MTSFSNLKLSNLHASIIIFCYRYVIAIDIVYDIPCYRQVYDKPMSITSYAMDIGLFVYCKHFSLLCLINQTWFLHYFLHLSPSCCSELSSPVVIHFFFLSLTCCSTPSPPVVVHFLHLSPTCCSTLSPPIVVHFLHLSPTCCSTPPPVTHLL